MKESRSRCDARFKIPDSWSAFSGSAILGDGSKFKEFPWVVFFCFVGVCVMSRVLVWLLLFLSAVVLAQPAELSKGKVSLSADFPMPPMPPEEVVRPTVAPLVAIARNSGLRRVDAVMNIAFDASGEPETVEILCPSGNSALDAALIAWAHQFRIEPGRPYVMNRSFLYGDINVPRRFCSRRPPPPPVTPLPPTPPSR